MLRILFIVCMPVFLYGQNDSLFQYVNIQSDFRSRLEQDWNSQKSDGTMRDNRSRMRIRARLGLSYEKGMESLGIRIRTGNPIKQQDPQITIGHSFNEFDNIPISIEKAYYKYKSDRWTIGLGKNDFAFQKNNELFWSDNVFPEGLHLACDLNKMDITAAHYILRSSGKGFDLDSFLSALQFNINFNEYVRISPAFYFFKRMPNIPDGASFFNLDYGILHLGGAVKSKKKSVQYKFDFYHNLSSYSAYDFIPDVFQKEVNGMTLGIAINELKEPKDWRSELTFAYLERFAIVDYLAQNDWARWDYSNFDSPDGRLSNFRGLEWVMAYQLNKKSSLTFKYYQVIDLVRNGDFHENGSRVRLDFDFKI